MRQGTTLNDFMHWDNTLFKGIVLPESVNEEYVVGYIMLECGLQEPVYKDYDVFKSQTHIWFAAHEWNIEKLIKLLKREYDPLHNYDKVEELNAEKKLDGKTTINEKEKETKGGKDTTAFERDKTEKDTYGGIDTETTKFGEEHGKNLTTDKTNTQTNNLTTATTSGKTTGEDETNTMSRTAFNATSWQEVEKNARNLTRTENGTETENKTGTVEDVGQIKETGESTKTGENATETQYGKTVDGKTDEQTTETKEYGATKDTDTDTTKKDDETTTTEEYNHIYGNIGLTTFQKMFMEEFELLGNVNLYQWIASKFSNDLMVGVYE